LKHMGLVDRSKSRLSSFGISGKEFRYVEGLLPEGFRLHRKMTDHDVRNLQAQGAQVIVLESRYTSEDLKEARAGCREEASKTLTQAEAKALPASAGGAITNTSAHPSMGLTPNEVKPDAPAPETPAPRMPAPKADDSASSTGTTEQAASTPAPAPRKAKAPTPKADSLARSTSTADAALLDVSSTPPGADVYVDEQLSGHTPATIILVPGDHRVVIKKSGFVVWQKKFKLPSGSTNVDAELVPKAK
jgi:hypothetical protein